jgi:lysine-specific demethylase 8
MYSLEQTENESPSTLPDQSESVVDYVTWLKPAEFAKRYFRPKKPVVITDMATQWPACNRWSFDFFAQLDPERAVMLEKGNVLQGETAFEADRMADYLGGLKKDCDVESVAENSVAAKRYLSMFRVFEQFPQLQTDVDFSLLEAMTLKQVYFAWLGPAGTLTGYHIDWIDNILAQISGRKRVWLVPPSSSKAMYPSNKYDYRSTLSEVEPNSWNAKHHPLFATVRPIEIILEPGQMLFIPRGWWHRVLSLTPSISINAFGHDLSGLLLHQSRATFLHTLHQLGLYGRKDCTCHKKTADGQRAR